MNTEIIVHGVLAVAIGIGGYWRVKKGDREGALFLAGTQPSIAIALSLFDLGTTFGDMQNALAGGEIFEALSLKMFHMTVGIVAGLAQEGITQFYLPIKAEEERSRESIKDAVVEGIASQMQEMNKQVRRVGQIIESVPNDIDVIVKRSTNNIKRESEITAGLVQSALLEHGKQATEAFRNDAQSIKQDLTLHSNAVSSSVKQATESAADTISSRIKQEMEQTMTEAGKQGHDVIMIVANQVANTLRSTTSQSMIATANLAKTSEEALQRIADLVPR